MRSAIGPLMVGLAGWCALGQVTLLTPDNPSIRLAVPAEWYWFLVATFAAFFLPGWRRRPLAATPALLATLPWWPVALPSVALIWTGAMAWLPILLAGIAAVAPANRPDDRPSGDVRPLRPALTAAALTIVVAIFAGWSLSPRLPGGDEPHYLIITQSLLQDGDLQIENNHNARDYAEYYPGEAQPDFRRRGRNRAIYSIHAPGTSVVVLPAFALAGYRGAQTTIVVLAATASALMWYAAWIATRDRRAAWVAWLAVAGTPTFVIQSVTIFPDSIGMFIVAVAVVALLRLGGIGRRLPVWGVVGASVLIATLPWLHTRFSILAAGLGVLAAWLIRVEPNVTAEERWRRLGAFFVAPVASTVAWFAFFYVIYGTPSPVYPYGDDRDTRLAHVPGGLLGLVFDAQFGLLAYSPILAAVVGGLFVRSGAEGRIVRGLVVAGLVYVAASASYWMWWAGVPAPPARFAAAILPVLVIPIATAWRAAGPALRAVWLTLLTISIALAAIVVGAAGARIAWNVRGVRANWLDWLSGLSDLSRAWPSFFWRLNPGDLTTERHFVSHVVLWVAIFAGSAVLLLRLRRNKPATSNALAAAWWLAVALMIAIQAGWWLNRASGLAAAPSQMSVLNEAVSGRRILQIRPFAIGPQRDLTGQLRLRAMRMDEVGESAASWLPLLEVPRGRFALDISLRRPRAGALDLRVGRSGAPLRRLPIAARTEQTHSLTLPAGAAVLFFEPDPVFAAAAERIELTPAKLDGPGPSYATTSAHFGNADVFFHGPAIYVEPDGFWVRGGQTAAFTIAFERGRPNVNLALANGEAANELGVEWASRKERLMLRPSESRTLTVDVSSEGVAFVRLTSPSGFRPSDDGVSEDRRYLGVRVKVLE